MFHPRLLEHFQNPRNAGELADASVIVEMENPICGDILKLWVKREGERVAAVRFKCRGCVASMACGSALTELVAGRPLVELGGITPAVVEQAVGELGAASKHAAVLAADTWKKTLAALARHK